MAETPDIVIAIGDEDSMPSALIDQHGLPCGSLVAGLTVSHHGGGASTPVTRRDS